MSESERERGKRWIDARVGRSALSDVISARVVTVRPAATESYIYARRFEGAPMKFSKTFSAELFIYFLAFRCAR